MSGWKGVGDALLGKHQKKLSEKEEALGDLLVGGIPGLVLGKLFRKKQRRK